MATLRKKNRLPNKRESEKARNRSASAKWAGNRGKSSAHLRVKWTVGNINRAVAVVEGTQGRKFRTILFAVCFAPSPSSCSQMRYLFFLFPSYLSFFLSFARLHIAREYFERNFPRRGLAGTPKEIS